MMQEHATFEDGGHGLEAGLMDWAENEAEMEYPPMVSAVETA